MRSLGVSSRGERMEEDLQWRERVEERVAAAAAKEVERAERKAMKGFVIEDSASDVTSGTAGEFEEKDDEDLYFAPEKNNVIFGSAVDGWAFTIRQFASLYEKKLGIKRSVLGESALGRFLPGAQDEESTWLQAPER